jgi:tetratricopeptide (TPR) repeat protein
VYQSTEKIWEDITQKQPKNARAWNNLGSHLILNGDSKKAIDHFEKALSLNPNLADAHSNIGLAFCNLKQFQKAIESLKKSIELEPNHRNAFLNLGVTASRDG